MSYNTRRGNIAFNKNISSSSVGQRRPIVTNNYIQQLPPQNSGTQQLQNSGYSTQQHAQRQQNQPTPQRQQGPTPSAQQQLAKQQQMLVQKKQQLALQQRQQQHKQQMVQQQKQQLVQKQQQEQLAQQKKELELQKQKQKELEQQKQKELEQQKQQELEKQKQLELEKLKELELQKQRELELEMQQRQEFDQQKQRELEEINQQKLEQVKHEHLLQKQSQEQQSMSVVEGQQLTTPTVLSQEESMENVSESRAERRRWTPRRKLSKYEIQRRRNFKLSRLLQPKNAMVVLNEVVKNVTYNVEDCDSSEGYIFRATVIIDDVKHEGFGMNKGASKNNAAEKALKYLVKHKKLMQVPKPDSNILNEAGVEPMDTSEKEEGEMPLAWQQFASFAVYKLLASWGEDPNLIKEDVKVVKKPSKKIPDNANLMNPLMLLNQMMPQTHFEELPRSSNGSYFTFSYKCTVNDQTFVGTGTSKKVAKRQAAFEICRTILGIEYPPELYTPPIPTSA